MTPLLFFNAETWASKDALVHWDWLPNADEASSQTSLEDYHAMEEMFAW
jgi:hypothetical protein